MSDALLLTLRDVIVMGTCAVWMGTVLAYLLLRSKGYSAKQILRNRARTLASDCRDTTLLYVMEVFYWSSTRLLLPFVGWMVSWRPPVNGARRKLAQLQRLYEVRERGLIHRGICIECRRHRRFNYDDPSTHDGRCDHIHPMAERFLLAEDGRLWCKTSYTFLYLQSWRRNRKRFWLWK